MRGAFRTILVAAGLTAGLACDRRPADPSANPANPPAKKTLVSNAPLPTTVIVTPLATLPTPEMATIAVLPSGDIYLVQGAGDVYVLKHSGAATMEPAGLKASLVLKRLAIDESAAKGRFVALAARDDGRLAFCFAGVNGTQPLSAIGTFDPRDQSLFITVDQIAISNAVERTLPDATTLDLDLSSDTSRPSLFTSGDKAWLWRAGEKYIRLLAIDRFAQLQPTLTPSRISLEEVKDVVERSTWEWSPTATPGEFFLTDTASRWIRRVDGQGHLTHVARFDESVATISPATFDAAGRLLVLACDRDGVVQGVLVQNGDVFTGITRDQFTGSSLGAQDLLRFDRLHAIPNLSNAFVAYEATSGRLMRVELK